MIALNDALDKRHNEVKHPIRLASLKWYLKCAHRNRAVHYRDFRFFGSQMKPLICLQYSAAADTRVITNQ